MASRSDREKQKLIQDKCQALLSDMLREEDNKYCVDCDAKGPRWASWNLGVFLCIRCAGIHRNLGVHISKVKSVNLDTWTPEQIACLQQMGNSKARAVYEANLPDNFRRPQTDASLEAFIRAKYEQKKYIAKEWVPPPMPKPAFDIDEDRRKEREQKRSRGKGAVEIPVLQQPVSALPRPHSTSTSPSVDKVKDLAQKPKSSTVDLLSLDSAPSSGTAAPSSQSAEDPFDAFMSAPLTTSAPSTASTTPVVSSSSQSSNPTDTTANNTNTTITTTTSLGDETDFFKQPSEPEKKPLSKESIMSLYSTSSTQPQPPPFGVPGGMYVGMQRFPPNQVIPAAPQVGQVMGLPNGMMVTSLPSGTPAVAQLPQQMASLQLGSQSWGVAAPAVTAVPGTQIPMVGVAVGQPALTTWTGTTQGHTLSTNLWQ